MKYAIVAAALAFAAPVYAQDYSNQALENWYRMQEQRERNTDRMLEQQQWMEQQRQQTLRDLYNQQRRW